MGLPASRLLDRGTTGRLQRRVQSAKGKPIMSKYTYTSQKEIRAGFSTWWRDRCRGVPAYATDTAAKNQAFSFYVDDLARSGSISDALAQRVTL
jgi:hypothetical protein